MIRRYQNENILWIDLTSPTKKEIREVIEEHQINSDIGDLLVEPNRNPLVELYSDVIFLVLHFPTFRQNNGHHRREIDFVIGKDFLITVHYEPIDTLHKFSKSFETHALLGNNENQHAGFLFFHIVQRLYNRFGGELEGIEDRLEESKARVFQGGEREMVKVLSDINKDLLDFKQVLRPHKGILKSLEVAGKNFFDENFLHYLHSISREYTKLSDTITAHKETLAEIRQTNDSLLSANSTQVMKTLTIITFVTYPSIFLSGLFSINVQDAPILGKPNDFWLVILLVVIATSATFAFFVYKRWL